MRDLAYLQGANDVALFLDDALGKIALQKLPNIDANGIAILQRRGGPHVGLTHHYWAISLQHFERADALVVIAKNLQQHIASSPRREQNIVRFEQTRVVRNQIFRFRGLQLKTTAERPGAAAQIEQIQLAIVMENDPILQSRFYQS